MRVPTGFGRCQKLGRSFTAGGAVQRQRLFAGELLQALAGFVDVGAVLLRAPSKFLTLNAKT